MKGSSLWGSRSDMSFGVLRSAEAAHDTQADTDIETRHGSAAVSEREMRYKSSHCPCCSSLASWCLISASPRATVKPRLRLGLERNKERARDIAKLCWRLLEAEHGLGGRQAVKAECWAQSISALLCVALRLVTGCCFSRKHVTAPRSNLFLVRLEIRATSEARASHAAKRCF